MQKGCATSTCTCKACERLQCHATPRRQNDRDPQVTPCSNATRQDRTPACALSTLASYSRMRLLSHSITTRATLQQQALHQPSQPGICRANRALQAMLEACRVRLYMQPLQIGGRMRQIAGKFAMKKCLKAVGLTLTHFLFALFACMCHRRGHAPARCKHEHMHPDNMHTHVQCVYGCSVCPTNRRIG